MFFETRAGRLGGILLALSLLLLSPSHAAADQRTVVVLMASRTHRDCNRNLAAAVRAQLSDLPVKLVVVWDDRLWPTFKNQVQAARQKAAAIKRRKKKVTALFWGCGTTRFRLVLYAPKQDRVLKRSLGTAQAGAQGEAAAIIVRMALSTLLRGRPPLTARPAPPPTRLPPRKPSAKGAQARKIPTRPRPSDASRSNGHKDRARAARGGADRPRPSAERGGGEKKRSSGDAVVAEPALARRVLSANSESRFWLRLGSGYSAEGFSTAAGLTHGLFLALEVQFVRNWYLSVDYRVTESIAGEALGVRARVGRYPLAVGLQFRWPWKRLEVGAAFRVVSEILHPRITQTSPQTQVSDDATSVLFAFVPALYCGVRLYWRLRAFLLIGAQIALNNRRFVVEREGESETLVYGWRTRPQGVVGLSADLF